MDYIYANIDLATIDQLCSNLKPENIREGVEIKIGNLPVIVGTLIPAENQEQEQEEK